MKFRVFIYHFFMFFTIIYSFKHIQFFWQSICLYFNRGFGPLIYVQNAVFQPPNLKTVGRNAFLVTEIRFSGGL